MGYRSDILLVVYPDYTDEESKVGLQESIIRKKGEDKYNTLKLLMQTKFKAVTENWNVEFDDAKHRLVIGEDNIKYYESFDEIAAFEDFKTEIVGLGYCTEFARIGEEYDDIVTEYNGNNLEYIVRINREIVIDG